jgi:hypothetical protein
MITVVSFAEAGSAVYGTAMNDGAGCERFYGYEIPVPTPCTEETIAAELQKQVD